MPICRAINIPAQGLFAHDLLSSKSPEQVLPEYDGSGLVQVRVRVLVPLPQDTVQSDQSDQSVSPPFIALTETTTILLSLPTLFIAVHVYMPASVILESWIRRVWLERTLEEPVRGVHDTMDTGRDST